MHFVVKKKRCPVDLLVPVEETPKNAPHWRRLRTFDATEVGISLPAQGRVVAENL